MLICNNSVTLQQFSIISVQEVCVCVYVCVGLSILFISHFSQICTHSCHLTDGHLTDVLIPVTKQQMVKVKMSSGVCVSFSTSYKLAQSFLYENLVCFPTRFMPYLLTKTFMCVQLALSPILNVCYFVAVLYLGENNLNLVTELWTIS